jgi:phosphonate transport system substrate-binding protein
VPRRSMLRVATHLAPGVLPAYALAAQRVGERLGRPSELIVAPDYGRCVADIDHVCFVCSLPYLLLAAAGAIRMDVLAAPLLRGRRYGRRPIYFSDVVVRADSAYRTLDDLRGQPWAFNEPYSHSGYLVVLHEVATRPDADGFLGDAVEAGFHDESLAMVLRGEVAWAAIDSQVLGIWMRRQPSLGGRLRVVATLGPSTIQPVVASSRRLTRAERAAVTGALTTLHLEPADRLVLQRAGIARFVAIGGEAYDDIRSMLATVERSGLLPAWWRPRWEALAAGTGR